jgi:hypothetical protein
LRNGERTVHTKHTEYTQLQEAVKSFFRAKIIQKRCNDSRVPAR